MYFVTQFAFFCVEKFSLEVQRKKINEMKIIYIVQSSVWFLTIGLVKTKTFPLDNLKIKNFENEN